MPNIITLSREISFTLDVARAASASFRHNTGNINFDLEFISGAGLKLNLSIAIILFLDFLNLVSRSIIQRKTTSYKFFLLTAESDSEDTSKAAVIFSKEDTVEMLKSDPEDMDCEDTNDDNSSAASDSFHSSTSLPDTHSGGAGILKVSGTYRSIQAARTPGQQLGPASGSPLQPAVTVGPPLQ